MFDKVASLVGADVAHWVSEALPFYGQIKLSWWGYVGLALSLTHITIISVTVFLHRHQAHRALDLHPALSHFFRAWLWLTTGMETKAWTAIHRKHHARCETPDDPHSPQVLGLSTVMWMGAELYRKEAKNQETLERYGQGTPDDWLERNVYRYSARGFLLLLFVQGVLFGVPGVIIWAIQMGWIPFFAAGVINGVGHYWGYRNIEHPDASTNIVPWGILVGGEELHNNHHAYPTSAKLSLRWFEFDLGWVYIRLFAKLGLARIKRLPPKMVYLAQKDEIDGQSLHALIVDRFRWMTDYKRDILLPVWVEEKSKIVSNFGIQQWSRLRRILRRDMALALPEERRVLDEVFSKLASTSHSKMVYQLKQQLEQIWAQTTATHRELIEALQAWCVKAEATGIKALQEFVQRMKRSSVVAT